MGKVVKKGSKKAGGRKPAAQNRTPKKEVLPSWVKAFTTAFAETGNVSAACRAAKVGRRTVYDLREQSEEFATLWDEAREEACEALELEARRRAKDGVTKTIFYKGEPIGTEHEYSDTLMIFLLKAHRPEVYRENVKLEHAGTLRVKSEKELSDDELKAIIAGVE